MKYSEVKKGMNVKIIADYLLKKWPKTKDKTITVEDINEEDIVHPIWISATEKIFSFKDIEGRDIFLDKIAVDPEEIDIAN